MNDVKEDYDFLSISNVDINHQIPSMPSYLVVGFPVTKSILKKAERKIKVSPFIYFSDSNQNEFKENYFQDFSHIKINYQKRRTKIFGREEVVMGPDTHGVSGAGLWTITNLLELEKDAEFKLVGLMTEWWPEQAILVSTRIHLITEFIRKCLKLDIPATSICNVNIS